MAKVKITGHASGTGVITVTAPNTSTDRTITLPDSTGTILDNTSTLDATKLSGALPALSGASLTGVNAINSGRKNMLINGDFSVSQRGTYTSATTATHLQYYLDRFYVANDGVTGTIQDTGFAAKLVATSSATGTLRLVQPIEDTVWLAGKTVTLSCQMKSNDSNSRLGIYAGAWQSTTATHTGGGAWETISITLTLPSSIGAELSTHFGIDGASSANVSISSGAYCEMKDLQLEVGSVATDFEHRSYGEELALCQRYFERFDYDKSGGGIGAVAGQCHSTSIMYGVFTFQTTKRVDPSMSTSTISGSNFRILHTGTTSNVTSMAWNASSSCARVGASCSGLTSGNAGIMDTGSSQGQYIDIDAEL